MQNGCATDATRATSTLLQQCISAFYEHHAFMTIAKTKFTLYPKYHVAHVASVAFQYLLVNVLNIVVITNVAQMSHWCRTDVAYCRIQNSYLNDTGNPIDANCARCCAIVITVSSSLSMPPGDRARLRCFLGIFAECFLRNSAVCRCDPALLAALF